MHALFQEAREPFAAERHDEDVDFGGAEGGGCAGGGVEAGFCEGEDAVDAEGDADAGDLGFSREHADEFVVAAAGGDGADADGGVVGAVFVEFRGGFFFAGGFGIVVVVGGGGFLCGSCCGGGGGAFGDDFVDYAGVVVEAAGEGEVEFDVGEDIEDFEVGEEEIHVLEAGD